MTKGFSSRKKAREGRQAGLTREEEFAKAIGGEKNDDSQTKTDVFDPSGGTHSVKSGSTKWQIFLYGENRFTTDPGFAVIGNLLVACINVFPKDRDKYESNERKHKRKLKPYMEAICKKLQNKKRLRDFFEKSIFNGREVKYLTILYESKFHILYRSQVLDKFINNLIVENSKATKEGEMDSQKVIFKYNNENLAELEMRNDSDKHYRQIRFNMIVPKAVDLLLLNSKLKKEKFNNKVLVYGKAIKKFGRWRVRV